MRYQTTLVLILAIIGSVIVGYIDSRATEVQATLIVMLPITFALGFAQPKHAWLWALIVGLSVPFGFLWHVLMGATYVEPPTNGFFTLMALIPAFIGAFSGAIFRKIVGEGMIRTSG